MPDGVFSAARLRGYRILEDDRLGSAADLYLFNTVTSARLWLPLSLIEIAFRNAVDAQVSATHPAAEAWICDRPEDQEGEIDWGGIQGRAIFRRRNPNLEDDDQDEAPEDSDEVDDDDSPGDPVAVASRMAGLHGRPNVTRDDVVSHLMLGFWVFRGPAGLLLEEPPIDVYELLSGHFGNAFGSAQEFESLMKNDILLTRNRVAHHEPVVIRARYIFNKKTGEPRRGNELVTSLIASTDKFRRLADKILSTAAVMAPMAAGTLTEVRRQIDADIDPFAESLVSRFDELKEARDARRQARRDQDDGQRRPL